jgi:predicted nucleic acid-binding protein
VSVLIDTFIWSAALRKGVGPEVETFRTIVNAEQATLIGAVRQETLCGIRDEARFFELRDRLAAFQGVSTESDDYVQAALFFNRCRAKGIQGSNTDFLMCAVSERTGYPVFTVDRDFEAYAKVIPVSLFVG